MITLNGFVNCGGSRGGVDSGGRGQWEGDNVPHHIEDGGGRRWFLICLHMLLGQVGTIRTWVETAQENIQKAILTLASNPTPHITMLSKNSSTCRVMM